MKQKLMSLYVKTSFLAGAGIGTVVGGIRGASYARSSTFPRWADPVILPPCLVGGAIAGGFAGGVSLVICPIAVPVYLISRQIKTAPG